VAPIVTGWLLQKTGNYEAPMFALLCVLVMGALSYIFLVREKYAPTAPPGGKQGGQKDDSPALSVTATLTPKGPAYSG
jgi:hypothetical protein